MQSMPVKTLNGSILCGSTAANYGGGIPIRRSEVAIEAWEPYLERA